MDPSNTLVGKHSRSVAVSVSDLLQVYIIQASPALQVCTCPGSVLSNFSHFLSGSRRLPQEKHWSPAPLSGLGGLGAGGLGSSRLEGS